MNKDGPPPQYSAPGQASTSILVAPRCHALGPGPQSMICPSCRARMVTQVRAESSTKTHLLAVLLCFVSCCCLPYLIDSCKSRNHYCPGCGAYLGSYNN